MHLLCVTVASNAIGFGHLNRCLSTAAAAAREDAVSLFVFGDGAADARLKASGHRYRIEPPGPGPAVRPTDTLAKAARAVDVVVADVVHSRFFEQAHPQAVFEAMRSEAGVVAAIDALGEQSLMARAPAVPVDILVVPYAVSDAERALAARVGRRQLAGPEFALLPPDYADLPERQQRGSGCRVLVTCGGSDPKGWTPVVLESLEAAPVPLEIRAVAGPLFDRALRDETARRAAASRHRVEVVDAPTTLAPHMLWCDIAIAASGLTKYELAATGTPTVLFSIDAIQEASNRSFAAQGSVVDLGPDPAPGLFVEETLRLLQDQDMRNKMAAAGRRLVDGAGTRRLVAELEKELTCSRAN